MIPLEFRHTEIEHYFDELKKENKLLKCNLIVRYIKIHIDESENSYEFKNFWKDKLSEILDSRFGKIKPEHVKEFVRLSKGLDKLMQKIIKYCPTAEFYAEGEAGLYLCRCSPQDERSGSIESISVVENVSVCRLGCGAW